MTKTLLLFTFFLLIIIQNNLAQADAGSDQVICRNTTVLDAVLETGAISQQWSIVSGSCTFDDVSDPKTMVRNIPYGANVFKWTVRYTDHTSSDNVLIVNDSIYTSGGSDATHCEPSHRMNAQQIYNGTGLWSIIGLGSGNIVNNTAWNTLVTDLSPGTNLFEWHTTNGYCESRDTVAIKYNLPPIAQFTSYATIFCSPKDVTVTNTSSYYAGLTPPDEFKWSIDNKYWATTYGLSESLVKTFTNSGTIDSIYKIRLVAIDNETQCTDTFFSNVTALAGPLVKFEPSAHEKRFPDASFGFENLSSTGLSSYMWSYGDGENSFHTSFVAEVNHTYATWGTYVVTLTGTSGGACNAMHTETIVILPPCPFSYNDPSLIAEGCEDLTVNFIANILFADSLEWDFEGNGVPDSNEPNPVYTYTEPGIYRPVVRAWNFGCDQVYIRRDTVLVFPKPTADFDVSPRFVDEDIQYIHTYNYSEFSKGFLWDFGDGTSSDEIEPIHLYTEPGNYDISLSVWSDKNCFDSIIKNDFVEVMALESPEESETWLFPNPTHGQIFILTKGNFEDVNISLHDLLGNQVPIEIYSSSAKHLELRIDKDNIGPFILNLKGVNYNLTYKIFLLR